MSEEIKKSNGGKVGAVLGGAAGALGTAMATPLGRFLILQSQDKVGGDILMFFTNTFKNPTAGRIIYDLYSTITNSIIAYPAILPIAGGLITATVGAIVGKKISKAKLKHKSLSQPKQIKAHAK